MLRQFIRIRKVTIRKLSFNSMLRKSVSVDDTTHSMHATAESKGYHFIIICFITEVRLLLHACTIISQNALCNDRDAIRLDGKREIG